MITALKAHASQGEWIDPRSACVLCKPNLETHDGPGIPVYQPGVIHRSSCDLVPHLSPEQIADYQAFCDEVARCQRQAWEKASSYVIG